MKPVLLLPGPDSAAAAQALFGEVYEYQSYLANSYTTDSVEFLANGHLSALSGRAVDVWQIPARGREQIQIEPILRQLLKLDCKVRVVAVSPDDDQYEPMVCRALGMSRDETLGWARSRVKQITDLPEEAPPARRGKPRSKPNGQPVRGIEIADTGGIDRPTSAYVSWEQLGLAAFDGKPPHANIDNVEKIIANHPELAGRIWFDEFHGKIFQTLFQDTAAEWADHHDTRLTVWIQRNLRLPKITHQLTARAVDDVARSFPRNEPREWMDSLAWDHVERLPTLMARGFGADQNDYTAAVGRCWMVAMVARTYEPGCKVDTMPVFEGFEGVRKSTALAAIGGPWFAEMHEDITSKDFLQNMPGKLLIEISELHAFRRAEINRIKGVISCASDRYRASYGRRAEDHPRRSVFAGTTNRDDWNESDTGARRFWPIRCGSIDLDFLRNTRHQLFAEAIARYRLGEAWWDIDPNLAKIEQDARRDDDAWSDVVMGYVDGRQYTFLRDILEHAIGKQVKDITRLDEMRVGSILRVNDWRKVQRRIGGQNVKIWVKKGSALDTQA